MENKVAKSGRSIRRISSTSVPPDSRRLIVALRQIGYSFEQALSDLIDNSINARASTVLIRFICEEQAIRSLVIADDGCGMSESVLADAMRFGSEKEADINSLGKYGMGLKLASISHARCLTVVTRKNAKVSARRWTIEGIENNWECEILEPDEAAEEIDIPWGGLDLKNSGTLVIWDDIDKLPVSSSGLKSTLRSLQRRLQVHLGLCFHRFLEDNKLRIIIDKQQYGEEENAISVPVEPLNPFDYPDSGNPEYPKYFRAKINGVGTIKAEGHIWPPNSDLPAYKLGGRAAARQGFYFYRNDRLIQAGGWNGLVQHESEPHSSLARVRIDLPSRLDDSFGLTVQKSAVIVPPNFEQGMEGSAADDGTTFEEYRRAAQKVYRKQDTGAKRDFPLVPGTGVPSAITSYAKELVTGGKGRVRKVDFEWKEFSSGNLFDVDRSTKTIFLNRAYRKLMLGNLNAGKADLPLFKIMLFMLVEEDFDRGKTSRQRREKIELLNRLFVEAAKLGRG